MKITTKQDKRLDFIEVSGRIDSKTAPQFTQALEKVIEQGRYNIIVDMEKLEYMSSAGFRALLSAQRNCMRNKRGEVKIANMPERIREALELAGFTELFKIYNYKRDEEINEEEFLGIGVFDEKLRLVSFSKDGKYRFIDGTEKLHNILYVTTAEALAMKAAIEELEFLINDTKATEQAFQAFFERNPRLILNDEYKKAHAHIALTREEGLLIPDFLLEPLDQNSLCDILDLKLPTAKLFVLKKSRMRYSAAVMEACAQLREYSNYFDDNINREKVFNEYGLLAYKPKMIVIIGRRGNIDPIAIKKMESDVPQLVLRTYDDVLNRAQAKLHSIK